MAAVHAFSPPRGRSLNASQLTVKNTFLDLPEVTAQPPRRSASAPARGGSNADDPMAGRPSPSQVSPRPEERLPGGRASPISRAAHSRLVKELTHINSKLTPARGFEQMPAGTSFATKSITPKMPPRSAVAWHMLIHSSGSSAIAPRAPAAQGLAPCRPPVRRQRLSAPMHQVYDNPADIENLDSIVEEFARLGFCEPARAPPWRRAARRRYKRECGSRSANAWQKAGRAVEATQESPREPKDEFWATSGGALENHKTYVEERPLPMPHLMPEEQASGYAVEIASSAGGARPELSDLLGRSIPTPIAICIRSHERCLRCQSVFSVCRGNRSDRTSMPSSMRRWPTEPYLTFLWSMG